MITHKNVTTTQIYADLVNSKELETANEISPKQGKNHKRQGEKYYFCTKSREKIPIKQEETINDDRHQPSLEVLFEIAKILNVDPKELIDSNEQ